jgi:hypothetical protein
MEMAKSRLSTNILSKRIVIPGRDAQRRERGIPSGTVLRRKIPGPALRAVPE